MENNTQIQTPFLQQVARDIVRRYGRDLGNIAIVFNNQRPVHYLKKYLADLQGQVFWSPQFFTIQEFLGQSTQRKEINRTAQVFLLNQLYTALQREQNPGFEDSLDQFFPIGEIMLDDFAQLDYELVDVGMIFRELEEIALLDRQFDFLTEEQQQFLVRFWSAFSKERQTEMQARFLQLWRLLPQLYHRFHAALRERDNHTMAGIYRDLAEGNPESRDVTADFQQVIFVGFNALNACESRLFKRWQENGKALFYFDADTYYYDDPQMEAGHFIRQNIGNHGLINALGEFPNRLSGQVDLIAAPGRTAQAKALAQLLEEQAAGTGSTAIILADESLLVPILQSIPERLTEKLNITMGYPMTESLTYGLIELILATQLSFASGASRSGEVITHDLLVGFIGHPFVVIAPAKRLELMKNLAEQGDISLSLPLVTTLLPEQTRRFTVFFKKAADVSALMEGMQSLLLSLSREPGASRLHNLIESTLMENAMQTFRQLQQGFEAYPDLSMTLAIKLIRRQLLRMTATLSGDPSSEIQVMGLLESRNLNFDHIYLVGANEGNLPALSSASSFIPYNLRRAYRLPVIENQQALSAYLFYRLLHRIEHLHLIYNAVVDNENAGDVSRFARQIRYESNLPVRERSVLLNGELRQQPLPTEGISIPKTGKVWERLQTFFQETPNKERRSLSASAFTLYVNSPLEFFFKYIAGIKEPPTLKTEMESNRVGNVIHRAMQLLYEPFLQQGRVLHPGDIHQLLQQVPTVCEQALVEEFRRTGGSATGEKFNGQERIVQRISEEYCRLFLEYDRNLGNPIELLELENDTDQYRLEFPVRVQGEQKSILLKGIIDRVDSVNGQKRIVDYKTGSDALDVHATAREEGGKFVFDFFGSNWEDSNKAFIQTLFYTYIYERLSGHQGIQPQLYSIRKIRQEGTDFRFKIPYKGNYPITGPVLEQVKTDFEEFLRGKLEELFDPAIPFIHPPGASVYEGSIFSNYVT